MNPVVAAASAVNDTRYRDLLIVHKKFVGTPIMTHFDVSFYRIENDMVPDFKTATGAILLIDVKSLTSPVEMKRCSERIKSSRPLNASKRNNIAYIILLYFEDRFQEPTLEALTFMNEACMESEATLLMCCGVQELKTTLEYLAKAAVTSSDLLRKKSGGDGKSSSNRSVMLAALQQAGVNANDCTRIVNRANTPADIFRMSEDIFDGSIQGFKEKKIENLSRVVNAQLPTTSRTLEQLTEDQMMMSGNGIGGRGGFLALSGATQMGRTSSSGSTAGLGGASVGGTFPQQSGVLSSGGAMGVSNSALQMTNSLAASCPPQLSDALSAALAKMDKDEDAENSDDELDVDLEF